MFFKPNELVNEVLYFNPDYKSAKTDVSHLVTLIHSIELVNGENYLIITIDIVFTPIEHELVTVIHISFSKDIKFDVTKHKSDDLVSLKDLLKDLDLEIEEFIKSKFPVAVIKIDSKLIADKKLKDLEDRIMLDLEKKKYYN